MNEQNHQMQWKGIPVLASQQSWLWINPNYQHPLQASAIDPEILAEIDQASQRLDRFAPFILEAFPETKQRGGIIESELRSIHHMKSLFETKENLTIAGKLMIKLDSHLPIAGSIKARGGIHEILAHSESLAKSAGMLEKGTDYRQFTSKYFRQFFAQYTIQVGSTGNLGLSIGIISAVLGYRVIVHMSADAKAWKKKLLRSYGVIIKEYDSDYSLAVEEGRKLSDQDPSSYFVDDENSRLLFAGYAVAARRLAQQFKQINLLVDSNHPLFVYLPCGVGGAPGGIAYGLKAIFGDSVHVFFAEPTLSPCMVLGMGTGLHDQIAVNDIGIEGVTHADGLAVGRPSAFVGKKMEPMLSGIATVQDHQLFDYLRWMQASESIFLEPSALAGFGALRNLHQSQEAAEYRASYLSAVDKGATHLIWATGGSLVPEQVRQQYRNTYLD